MAKNIYELYIENGCRFGFYISRNSWNNGKYAVVTGIDGVEDGQMIDGEAPYFTRYYPDGHPKAGKVWKRKVYYSAPWMKGGKDETESGGTYAWKKVKV